MGVFYPPRLGDWRTAVGALISLLLAAAAAVVAVTPAGCCCSRCSTRRRRRRRRKGEERWRLPRTPQVAAAAGFDDCGARLGVCAAAAAAAAAVVEAAAAAWAAGRLLIQQRCPCVRLLECEMELKRPAHQYESPPAADSPAHSPALIDLTTHLHTLHWGNWGKKSRSVTLSEVVDG